MPGHEIAEDLDKLDRMSGPGWPRRRCQVEVVTTVRAYGAAATADMAHGEMWLEGTEPGRRNVYSGPVLFDLTITVRVVRSFTDKPNGSNSREHQLSVVKRRTERRL